MVINYDLPASGVTYVHRIGRTARAEADGVAITLINEEEQFKFLTIEKLLEKEVYKAQLPVHLGEGPEYNPEKPKPRKPFKKRYGNKKGAQKRPKKS